MNASGRVSRLSINPLQKFTFAINYQIAYENYSNAIKYFIKYRQINDEIEKLIIGYKEIIKDFQKKIIQLNDNLIKLSKNNDKILYNNDFNIYPLIKKYVKYLNSVFTSQINSLGDQINDLSNTNIFKSINKKDDNIIELLQQKKNSLQNQGKHMEKLLVEYDNGYDKLMNVFYEAENTIKKFFVQKNKKKETKINNINIFNETISNTLNSEEDFCQIYINFKTENHNFFNNYEKNINDIETEIIKISNSLYCNINAFSLLLLNSNNDFIKKLIKFREKLNTKEEELFLEIEDIPEKNNNTNNKETKSNNNKDFKLFKNKYFNELETKYNKEKYKVRSIHETISPDIIKKETKSIMNSLNNEFGLDNYVEETPIILTEEDIYEITKTFYGAFQFVDKTEYNLEIEKKKLDLKNLTHKLLYFGFKRRKKDYSNIGPISDEEVESLSNSLKKREFRYIFLQRLNNFRGIGIFEIPEREFKIITTFFKTIVDILSEEKEIDLPCTEFILILSQTFFTNKNGERVYIQNEIKGHKFFNNKDFWNIYIKDAINKEINKMKENIKKNNLQFKKISIGSLAFSHILSFCNNMIDLGMPKEILIEIIEPLYKEYQLDEEMKKNINDLIETPK